MEALKQPPAKMVSESVECPTCGLLAAAPYALWWQPGVYELGCPNGHVFTVEHAKP